jgi:hypothetical protein
MVGESTAIGNKGIQSRKKSLYDGDTWSITIDHMIGQSGFTAIVSQCDGL